MSNQAEITTARIYNVDSNMMTTTTTMIRDQDELEATLLPVATEIMGSAGSASTTTTAATVCEMAGGMVISDFDYDTAIAAEVQQQHQIAHALPSNNSNNNNSNNASAAITDDSHTKVKQAQQVGLLASEAEKEAIRRANRNVYSQGYYERQAIEQANEMARQREREGLQIREDFDAAAVAAKEQQRLREEAEKRKNELLEPNNNSNSKKQQKNKGGYQISEYQFGSDYEVSDYKMSEYKSVYD